MKKLLLGLICLALALVPILANAEVRTYTEEVRVKITDDELTARKQAEQRARELVLARYLREVYPDRSGNINLTGDDSYFQDIEILESKTEGMFSKELIAKIRISLNEEPIRAYLKRQGIVKGKNEDRRIVVMLIPGKMDTGDAPFILDNVRAEVRRSLTAAEYTVIDSDDEAVNKTLTEEADYNKMVQHINKIADELADKGEWLILGKVDIDVVPSSGAYLYRTLMTGKAVSLANRDIMWEGNPDAVARAPKSEAKAALRQSAIAGGQSFAKSVVAALNTKTLTQERRGARFELVMPTAGNYRLERKILKTLSEDIKGLKNVSQKNRGKGNLVVDLFYAGKISDLVDLLMDNFDKDPALKKWNPEIQGNKVVFK